MSEDIEKWWGRVGYDREGIVREREFNSKDEALAYAMGALDMKEQCDLEDDSPLEGYWATASNEKSIEE